MIDLRKKDSLAASIEEILQQEALKGGQKKIDKNHNGKIDGQDFKILRGEKKVEEEAGRTEDTLSGKPKAKTGDDVGPGADGKSSKVKLKSEEVESFEEGIKDAVKKTLKVTFKALTGGSDEDQRKDLQRKMGVPQTGKKPTQKEEVEGKQLKTLRQFKEGWDDMVKDAKEKVKSGPKANGGSGVKQGSAYGGSKQKDKPEQDTDEKK